MDYSLRVHRVMDYVRAHLAGDLRLAALARVGGFAPYHFHRVFKAVAGETLAEFTRRARLERAAYLMMGAPSRSLVSIALECGFASHSDLTRAFRRLYGIAPSRWDRNSRLERAQEATPCSATPGAAPSPSALDFEPCVRSYPPYRLAYIRMRTWFVGDALPRGYAVLTAWLDARGIDWRSRPLLGMSWDNYETTPLEQVRYDFGVPVSAEVSAEGPVGIHELPAMDAVDVHCRGGLPRIAAAWDYLYQHWLPRSGYEPADLPGIKRFRTRPDVLGWDTWDLDCSIPIRPRSP